MDKYIVNTKIFINFISIRYEYSQPNFGSIPYTYEWVWRTIVAAILCQNERSSKVIYFCNNVLFKEFKRADDFIKKKDRFAYILKKFKFRFVDKQVPWILNIANYLVNNNYMLPTYKQGLMEFPGIGEHISELVCSNCYNQPYMAKDVHVNRIMSRIGLDVRLLKKYSVEDLSSLSNKISSFGKEFCSYNPKCEKCPFHNNICRFKKSKVNCKQLELDV